VNSIIHEFRVAQRKQSRAIAKALGVHHPIAEEAGEP
jgi:hypothetical protein